MRKAKRGLKRSEARRGGHRAYVHKDRPEDVLRSGSAFPRQIRVRTTAFASQAEARAMTNSASSAAAAAGAAAALAAAAVHLSGSLGDSEYRAMRGRGGGEGSEKKEAVAAIQAGGPGCSTAPSHSRSFPLRASFGSEPAAGSWGSEMLQAMSDAARAPADSGVAVNHARVLREWKRR